MIFSVIVPFLNEERYIRQCIESLLNQDFNKDEYELIFVDNGSTDKSISIVKQYSQIILLREYKKYEYACFNAGLKHATGNIAVFTNADCLVSNDWLSQIYRGIKLSNADVVLGRCYFPLTYSFLMRMLEEYGNFNASYIFKNCSTKEFFGYTNNMAIKMDIFKKIGFFCEAHRGADTEFIQRVVSRISNAKVMFLPDMKVIHLEMRSIKIWLEKNIIYGSNNRIVMLSSEYKSRSCYAKFRTFSYFVNTNNYRLWQKFIFLVLLIFGNFCYNIGWAIGYIRFLKIKINTIKASKIQDKAFLNQ
jgi:glycosyltransferase involved in cell wall biosynthesis